MQILIAIEEPLLAELIAFRLELLGHQVEIRATAEQLHLALGDTSYAMAVVDTSLPDASMRETLSKLRTRWSREQLPIMVVSVDQSLELVEQAVRFGADDYLLIPFDPQSLQFKLDRLLQSAALSKA